MFKSNVPGILFLQEGYRPFSRTGLFPAANQSPIFAESFPGAVDRGKHVQRNKEYTVRRALSYRHRERC